MKASFTSMTPPGAPLPPTLAPPASDATALPSLSDPFDEINRSQNVAPAASSGSAIKEEPTSLEQLNRFAAGGYLYALLDATDQILVPQKAKELGPTKAISLFSGTAKEQYWQVAPYLFQVDPLLLDWAVAKLWKEPWGIFAITKAKFDDLRVHFKKFLLAQLPDGKVWYFRYYDPRILKAYLPVCDAWELQKFFGPIRAFAIAGGEQEKPAMVQSLNVSQNPRRAQSDATVWWKIRSEQQTEFKKAAEMGFVNACQAFLQKKLPDKVNVLPPQVFLQRVEAGIARARSYGITWRSALLNFVTLMFELGPAFDLHPLIQPILRDERVRPDHRINHVAKVICPQESEKIAGSLDPEMWDAVVRRTRLV